MNPVEIILRPYTPETDDPYIYSTWTKYAWYSPPEPIRTPKAQWFAEKIQSIKELLPRATIRIACFKDQPYVIAGYIVIAHGRTQWLCIKKEYRDEGIEALLTQDKRPHGRIQETEVEPEPAKAD